MQVINKKAKFNYNLFERIEAGIVLSGSEAKAVRTGRTDLSNSYAKIINGEVFLINVNIAIEGKKDYTPTRTRKLLLHKDQIIFLQSKIKAKNLTLVPVRMYNSKRIFKIELALASPKRKFDKKDAIKKRDIEREIAQELKNIGGR